jgi:hypothetical protein
MRWRRASRWRGSRCRRVVSFTSAWPPRERAPLIQRTEGRVYPEASLDEEKHHCLCRESNPGRPAHRMLTLDGLSVSPDLYNEKYITHFVMRDCVRTADNNNVIMLHVQHHNLVKKNNAGSDVLTAMVMASSIFWDIILINFLIFVGWVRLSSLGTSATS